MTKKIKLRIMAAVSAALLLGGSLLYFKDDIAQNISDDNLKPFRPITVPQGQLDDFANDDISAENPIADIVNGSAETSVFNEKNETVQVSDTLSEEVFQSLINSAKTLNEVYPDAVGWLYIPDTPINYPVMQGGDNEFYLSHAFDGNSLKSGSVFLDFRCENRFMNYVNILYGHNMRNGSMFAGVLKFANSAYLDSHRYGWLSTPETVYRVDFFSCAKTDWHDELYDGSLSVTDWIPHVENLSVVCREMEYSENDRFISLSTCSYEFQNARTILTGKLVETIGG